MEQPPETEPRDAGAATLRRERGGWEGPLPPNAHFTAGCWRPALRVALCPPHTAHEDACCWGSRGALLPTPGRIARGTHRPLRWHRGVTSVPGASGPMEPTPSPPSCAARLLRGPTPLQVPGQAPTCTVSWHLSPVQQPGQSSGAEPPPPPAPRLSFPLDLSLAPAALREPAVTSWVLLSAEPSSSPPAAPASYRQGGCSELAELRLTTPPAPRPPAEQGQRTGPRGALALHHEEEKRGWSAWVQVTHRAARPEPRVQVWPRTALQGSP